MLQMVVVANAERLRQHLLSKYSVVENNALLNEKGRLSQLHFYEGRLGKLGYCQVFQLYMDPKHIV